MAKTGDFILVHFINPQSIGLTFERRRMQWPLHITLIVWFGLPAAARQDELEARLQEVAGSSAPFDLEIGPVAYFGPKKDVPVNTVLNQSPAHSLHINLKKTLDTLEVSYQSEQWTGNAFTAHITQHGDAEVEAGTTLRIEDFYLAELLPKNTCRVVKRYDLVYNT